MPLQRNATDHPLDVPAASATVQPGDTVDWDDPITGFEPVEDEPAATGDRAGTDGQTDPRTAPAPSPKTRKSTAKRAADGEEDTA